MLDIWLEKNRDLYTNYLKCLDYLNDIDEENFHIGERKNFHVYSEIKSDKELLCVESYLATQDLDKTKLISVRA